MNVTRRKRARGHAGVRSLLLVVLALTLPVTGRAHAQSNCATNPGSCSPNSNPLQISITIGRAIQLTLAPGSTTLSVPGPADYDAGIVATNGPTVTVRSNAPWTVSLGASVATWIAVDTQSEPARTDKPAGDLQWALSAAGPFADISSTPATIATGARTTGTSVTLFYRTKYSWLLDTPGNYRIPLVFTIIAP